ncbi:CBS domain-containing protein [Salinimicrobium soli]|uniref:CBS domain-containing protein n=1 Tax=Salinimicrobium soli TaxID=1254399 RepID=UPI003AAFE269
MSIEPYILNDIKMPDITSKIGEIRKLLEPPEYSHIPIQHEGTYVGSISENDIITFDPEKTVEEYQYSLEGFFVRDTENWMDVLHNFSKNQTNIMPVLDEENHYLGYLELYDIMNLFTEAPFIANPGGIFTVEKGYKDYSFSEITQIIESNGAQILGAFVSRLENDMAQITIKTGPTPVNAILQAFRRYGYKIASTHQEDKYSSDLKDRSDYLDKYLNI